MIAGLLAWDDLFDVVVDSSQVGMRKPDSRIFARTLDLLALEPGRVVFVDDQPGNVAAAGALGMRTIHAERFDAIAGQLREHVEAWLGDDR
jgi:HAD superfamily hydrolase (TIGR01509 family)